MRTFILLCILLFSLDSNSQKTMIDNSVISSQFNIERYLGTWYEIARYDHTFERDLVGVTATYSLRKDGKIKVLNSGYKNTLHGKCTEAVGKAKIPNINEPAKLKVSFFLWFYADYYIMELDNDYQWAIVGSTSENYLWILSRQPLMEDAIFQSLLCKLKIRGYDITELIMVEQKPIINFPPF